MRIIIIGDQKRYENYMPELEVTKSSELIYFRRGSTDEEILSRCTQAEVILADAISPVSKRLIEGLRGLKMVHSEGVAFDKIDLGAASSAGVYVCNNKGANAPAVAEQAILLMLGLLRSVTEGDEAVRGGRQIEFKENSMVRGITDLSDCTVGLIGFGDIAKATAARLNAFGSKCLYHSRTRKPPELEKEYAVCYLPLDELLPLCDIISLHTPVTAETENMANADFLSKMKPGSYLINTGRGELVDQEALCAALSSGHLAGAGLDTLYPEPVTTENPLVRLAAENPNKILFSPHIGGITTGSFRRMHDHMWQNVRKIANGERPDCIIG